MKENILLKNIDKPELLEEAYRRSPQDFEEQLKEALEHNSSSETLKAWNARLTYARSTPQPKCSIGFLVLLCIAAGAIVKIPSILPVDGDWFYPRFAPVTIISAVILYFVKTSESHIAFFKSMLVAVCASFLYLAILPNEKNSASVTMAIVHLPLFALSLLSVSFMGDSWKSAASRLNFIRYLGEVGIYSALILLGGIVLTGVTLGLFSLIDLSIERWYLEYVVVLGLVSAPIVATYLFDSVQHRESKFAPILSNVFSPPIPDNGTRIPYCHSLSGENSFHRSRLSHYLQWSPGYDSGIDHFLNFRKKIGEWPFGIRLHKCCPSGCNACCRYRCIVSDII